MQKFDLRTSPSSPCLPCMAALCVCVCIPVRSQSDSHFCSLIASLLHCSPPHPPTHATHAGGQDNKVEHNLLLQQISTVDENGQAVVKGTKVSRGYYADNGPPTTLSGTGTGRRTHTHTHTQHASLNSVKGNKENPLKSVLCTYRAPSCASDRQTLRHLAVGRGGGAGACYIT